MSRPLDSSERWDDVHVHDPERAYLVVTLPRTGSTWLCDALCDTGRLGVPLEYFNPVTMGEFYDRLGVPRPRPRARLAQWRRRMDHQPPSRLLTTWHTPSSMRSYLRWLTSHRTSATGAFGIKVHREEHERILRSTGLDAFDLARPRRVVWLRRHDRARQAISLYRAKATTVWHSTDGRQGRPDPPFDADAVRAVIAELAASDERWEADLAARDLPVHQVFYEELAEDRPAVLADCFAFLGAPGTPVPPSSLERRADEVTEEWIDAAPSRSVRLRPTRWPRR